MRSMKHIRSVGYWGLAMFAIVMSPILVILGIPVAIGVGLDVFELAGEMPLILLLCLPVVIMLLRRFSVAAALRRGVARLWSRLHLDHVADFIHAP